HPCEFHVEDVPSDSMVIVPALRSLKRLERLLLQPFIRNIEDRCNAGTDQYEESRKCNYDDDIFLVHGNNIPNSIISTILTHAREVSSFSRIKKTSRIMCGMPVDLNIGISKCSSRPLFRLRSLQNVRRRLLTGSVHRSSGHCR